jgi:hypothetical protein
MPLVALARKHDCPEKVKRIFPDAVNKSRGNHIADYRTSRLLVTDYAGTLDNRRER